MTYRTYSPQYKARLVARMRGPDATSARILAKETGVAQTTLSRWLRDAEDRPLTDFDSKPEKPRRQKRWTFKEKLRVLAAAQELTEEQLGAYLRREGVHPDQLRAWQDALEGGRPDRTAERRIRELEREVKRKDKALAEAAALLLLKKKARELGLLGDEDESTDEPSES